MSSYEVPFKSSKDHTKKFLKTIEKMIESNEVKKKKQFVKSDAKKYIKAKGRTRLVYFGKKGGKYYLKDGKKHYIPKNAKLITKSKIYKGGYLNNDVITSTITIATLFGLAKKLQKDLKSKKTKKTKKKPKKKI
mgnify:CR=1 FL=1